MRTTAMFIVCILLVCSAGAFAADAPATQPAVAAFDRLKALAGDWKGKNSHGEDEATHFKIAAADSAVVEDMHMGMVSVYTLDNERLLMTHYCAAQNQPRMVADAIQPAAKALAFHFLDATGMKSPAEGHMHALKVTFIDPDHFTEKWTFRQEGKDVFGEVMSFERVKK